MLFAPFRRCRVAAMTLPLAAGLAALAASNPSSATAHPVLPAGARPAGPATQTPNPFKNGDAWITYISGTETITKPGSLPTSVPIAETVTDTQTCPVTYNGFSGLCQDQETFSDIPDNTISYYGGFVQNGPFTDFDFFGSTAADQIGTDTVHQVETVSPAQVTYRFPEAMGNHFNDENRTDVIARTLYGLNHYLETQYEVTWPTGAYHDVTHVNDPQANTKSAATYIVHKDGSGTFNFVQTGANPSTFSQTFGAPSITNGQWFIPVTTTVGNNSSTAQVPDWFPGGGPAPQRLDTIPIVDQGPVAMPPACGLYAGQVGEDYRTTATVYLDPLAGQYTTDVSDYYFVDNIGVVCAPDTYTAQFYDNANTGNLLETDQYVQTGILQTYSFPNGMWQKRGHARLLRAPVGRFGRENFARGTSMTAHLPPAAAGWLKLHGVSLR
jgi:hypothetical protein